MAKTLPKVFYGLHMYPGTAEYRDGKSEPYRLYIGEEAIKNMGPTFAGKPVYVKHVDSVNLENIQEEADGYVMESFYNPVDGKHWAKFIVVSDKGHEAIRSGWKLSNAYVPKEMSAGGLCNGVEYQKEVLRGEYEHLAIVPNPRYEESVILTPEEFKAYNANKELELKKLANSKEKGDSSMLNLFKKQKVENSAEFDQMSVTLPKSKRELTLTQLVTEFDSIQNMNGYANGDHMVKVGEDEMSVNDLVTKHLELQSSLKKNAEEEEAKKKENEGKEKDPMDGEKKENEEIEEEKKKKENADKEDKVKESEESKKNSAHFDALKNAPSSVIKNKQSFELSEDRIARGKSRYGSVN